MREPGRIHAANVDRSPRLQRFLTALRKAKVPMSTRTLQIVAAVCNPNSCAAELRAQGYQVEVERKGDLFFYSLVKPAAPGKRLQTPRVTAEMQPGLF